MEAVTIPSHNSAFILSICFLHSQCFCTERCTCSIVPPLSPSSSAGSEYLNHRRWSQEHLVSSLKLPQQVAASTPVNLSPCVTPTRSRRGSRSSWSQGGDSFQGKGDDICIVVTDADPKSNPWGSCEMAQEGASWMANFTTITTQEPKERNSPKNRSSSPGLNEDQFSLVLGFLLW